MTEKYIDLHDEIADSIHWDATVADTLKWLDDHPDQVPGRTVTASEFDEAVESCVTEDATVPPHTFAARLGVVCVPDRSRRTRSCWSKTSPESTEPT